MSKPTGRRDFLKRTARAAGAVALAGSVVPRVHAAGDETIKLALIGCGGRGAGAVAQALKTEGPIKLWAMADVFANKLEFSLKALLKGQESRYDRDSHKGFSDRIDVPSQRRFVGFDAYKQAIDSGVDLVILATFPHFRPMHYEYAAAQGKHVFMEKPVAVDAPGIRRLLAANEVAKKKDLKVGVGLQRRHHRGYQEIIKRLAEGAIGEYELMRCYWNSSPVSGPGLCPEGMTEMQHQLDNPYDFTWLSGDHIVEQHVHNIDVCYWIKGEHPAEAQGQGGRQWRNGRRDGEIFDHHCVEFTYADGTKMFSQCRHIPGCWGHVGEYVLGAKGSAEISGYGHAGTIKTAEDKWRFRGDVPNAYQVEHDVLLDAIRNNKPHNEAEYGAMSTMTAIMGRMATYSGQVVRWDEALQSNIELKPDRYAWDGTPPVVPDENGCYPCAMPGVTKAV